MTAPDPDQPGDDPEERDSGLARERTSLSWTRTAIAFAALGGTVLKVNLATGLIILAIAPVIWQLGRVSGRRGRGRGGRPPGHGRGQRDEAVPDHGLDRRGRAALPGHRHPRPVRPRRAELAGGRA